MHGIPSGKRLQLSEMAQSDHRFAELKDVDFPHVDATGEIRSFTRGNGDMSNQSGGQ